MVVDGISKWDRLGFYAIYIDILYLLGYGDKEI